MTGGIGAFLNPKVLTQKVGPLPVWAYAATFGGVYYVFSRRNGGNNKGVQAPTVVADTSGYYSGYRPSMPVAGSGGSSQPVTPTQPVLTSPNPNDPNGIMGQKPKVLDRPPPLYYSKPNGDVTHDQAIQNPAVSQYLQALYLQGLEAKGQAVVSPTPPTAAAQPVYSSPTGDSAHDAAIQNPAVSAYLQSLYNSGQ